MTAIGLASRNTTLRSALISFSSKYQLLMKPFPSLQSRSGYPFHIIKYHRVLPYYDDFAIDVVTCQDFQWQMDILSSYFNVISFNELVENLNKDKLESNTVCITFDDGYADNYKYAFPILKNLNLKATIFLTTDLIGTDEMLWHDKVLFSIKKMKPHDFAIEKAHIFSSLETIEERIRVSLKVLEWLKTFDPVERDMHIQTLWDKVKDSGNSTNRFMLNWQEIQEMHHAGIFFGAHTKTHPILSTLTTSQIVDEIVGSKKAIEKHIKQDVRVFAYPNGQRGDFDERAKSVLRQEGFHSAVTTCHGVNSFKTDRYELQRSSLWDNTPNRFHGRLRLETLMGSQQ